MAVDKYKRRYDLETDLAKKNWIGKVFDSNNYGKFKVVGVLNRNESGLLTYICKFIDTGFETVASISNIRRGSLKDRYAKEVKGVGCIGDYYGNPSNNPFYITWMNMLARTHGMSVGNGAEVYENATMCDRWLNFTNFVEDMGTLVGNDDRVKYKYVKFDIDKDIFFAWKQALQL